MAQKHILLKRASAFNRKGQGLVEYALLIAAVVGIVVFVARGSLKSGVNTVVQTVMDRATEAAGS